MKKVSIIFTLFFLFLSTQGQVSDCELYLKAMEQEILNGEYQKAKKSLKFYYETRDKNFKCQELNSKQKIKQLLEKIEALESEEFEIKKNAKKYADNIVLLTLREKTGFGLIVAKRKNKLIIVTSNENSLNGSITPKVSFFDNNIESLIGEELKVKPHSYGIVLLEVPMPDSYKWNFEAYARIKEDKRVLLGDRMMIGGTPHIDGDIVSVSRKNQDNIEVQNGNNILIRSLGGPAIGKDGIVGLVLEDENGVVQILDIKTIQDWIKPIIKPDNNFPTKTQRTLMLTTGLLASGAGSVLLKKALDDYDTYKNVPLDRLQDRMKHFRGDDRDEFYNQMEKRSKIAQGLLIGGGVVLLTAISDKVPLVKEIYSSDINIMQVKASIIPITLNGMGNTYPGYTGFGINLQLKF